MNTTCLEQLVGLNECTTEFGYALNQLGLSPKQLDELLDDSYPNVEDMVDAMKNIAAKRLIADVTSGIPGSIKVNSMIENGSAGIFDDDKKTKTGGDFRGIRMQVRNSSEFVNLVINSVSLFLNHSGAITVRIIDLTSGQNVGTVELTAVAGEIVKVPCEISLPSSRQNIRLAVVYDATGITSYNTTIFNNGCSNCGGGSQFTSAYFSITGITATSPFLYQNTQVAQHTGGLSIEYSLQCATELWLCSARSLLGLPMLYATAVSIYEYAIFNTSQFSDQKTINFERNQQRYAIAQTEYQDKLQKVINSIQYPQGRCFVCDGRVSIISRLPG